MQAVKVARRMGDGAGVDEGILIWWAGLQNFTVAVNNLLSVL
jgi:hypothetical protein